MRHGSTLTAHRVALIVGLFGVGACNVQLDPPDRSSRETRASSTLNSTASFDRQQDVRSEDTSAVLPVLMIDLLGKEITRGRETPGVLKVIEDHDGSLKDLPANPISMESRVTVDIHGESSTALAKKSYQLEIVDERLKDRDLPLLGLPPGSDWVLHSCAADRTCLRNVLAYSLGREFERYAPRTRFVELFVNSTYQGIYVLVERVRRGANRVDLPRPSPTATDGDMTGSYIFKMDLGEGSPTDPVRREWVSPVSQSVYSYYYPRFNEITSAQRAYLHDHVSRFEAMMHGSGWNDADSGYRRWLDVPSWVDFALIQELSANPDAYFKSVYLQKWPQSMGNKIALGPIWDFDLAFGAADFRDARNTQAWAHTMNRFGVVRVPSDPRREAPYVPVHWERLWTDTAFQQDLRCRWQDLREGPLQLSALHSMIDGWVEQLADAQPRDAAVWGNPPANAYAGEVESLKAFIGKRLVWMDANLPGRCTA